ncbi:hypothetical protein CB1_000261038 [Camelus ferus]|nr:hypothetical protein CB1_000261038 [Camelus ferus]
MEVVSSYATVLKPPLLRKDQASAWAVTNAQTDHGHRFSDGNPWYHKGPGGSAFLTQAGLRTWEIRDVIYPDELSDSESAKVLEGFDIAESGHWVQQLHWSWWQSFKNEMERNIQRKQCS